MKKIAIVGTNNNGIFGVSIKYMEWARQFGEVVVLSPHAEFDESIDLLIMQGGADVDQKRYDKKTFFHVSFTNPHLEYFDVNVLPKYIEAKTPVFGICRGLQSLNVHFGGTLKNIYLHKTNGENRSKLVHNISVEGEDIGGINSIHHQAIDKLGEGLEAIAYCTDDINVIEAIKHKTLPVMAVQYHPEEIYDGFAIGLVGELINK